MKTKIINFYNSGISIYYFIIIIINNNNNNSNYCID